MVPDLYDKITNGFVRIIELTIRKREVYFNSDPLNNPVVSH